MLHNTAPVVISTNNPLTVETKIVKPRYKYINLLDLMILSSRARDAAGTMMYELVGDYVKGIYRRTMWRKQNSWLAKLGIISSVGASSPSPITVEKIAYKRKYKALGGLTLHDYVEFRFKYLTNRLERLEDNIYEAQDDGAGASVWISKTDYDMITDIANGMWQYEHVKGMDQIIREINRY